DRGRRTAGPCRTPAPDDTPADEVRQRPGAGVSRENRFDIGVTKDVASLHSKRVLEISRKRRLQKAPTGRDAMEKYGFIDTDSHVIEPDDLWDKYLDPKFRDQAPITRVGYKT